MTNFFKCSQMLNFVDCTYHIEWLIGERDANVILGILCKMEMYARPRKEIFHVITRNNLVERMSFTNIKITMKRFLFVASVSLATRNSLF